jgi:hypothetical protein
MGGLARHNVRILTGRFGLIPFTPLKDLVDNPNNSANDDGTEGSIAGQSTGQLIIIMDLFWVPKLSRDSRSRPHHHYHYRPHPRSKSWS